MSRRIAAAILTTLCLGGVFADAKDKDAKSLHSYEVKNLEGKPVKLADYKGKVVLVVNTASECGLTPQYKDLQALHEQFKDEGLVVIGFPCNQFGGQEPGSAQQIRTFCTDNYKVTFPLMAKIDVNGPKADPLYKWLTADHGGKIRWNFTKFLIGRDGKAVTRFEPGTKPSDKKVVGAVKAALAKKAKDAPASRPSK